MDPPITDPVIEFTLLVLAALLVQLTFERSRVPGLTGLILIGILIGPGGAGVLPDGPVIALLGSVGLLWIMFLAGLEVDLDAARRRGREVASFGAASFMIPFALVFVIGMIYGLEPAGALLLAAALSSHTLVAYPLLGRLGVSGRTAFITALGGTLATDTAALVALTLVIQGGEEGDIVARVRPLALFFALAASVFFLIPRLARWVLSSRRATPAEKALFVVATLMAAATAADLVGGEDILGAFVAGVALNRAVHGRPELQEHITFVGRMLFVPFFFIATGMRLELELLRGAPEIWALAAGLTLAVLVAKAAAAWLVGARYGHSPMERLAITGLTIPQAAATLAVTVTAREAGLVPAEILDAVVLVILLTCLAGPLIVQFAGRRIAAQPGDASESADAPMR